MRYGCPHPECKQRFATLGDKKRHLKAEHADSKKEKSRG